MATVSEQLGEFTANVSLVHLPPEVVSKAKACLLWGIGVALSTDESYANNVVAREVAAAFATAAPAAPGSGSTVFLNGIKTSPADAAFANGVLFNQTMCDSYLAASHFAPAVLPPVLALAEHEGQSGAEVLAAIVAGYEVACAMTKDHLGPSVDRGWRATIFDVFGAVAASARLMRLDAEQTGNAIAFASELASGNMESDYDRRRDSAQSVGAGFGFGIAARNGLTTAWLARGGALAPRTAIEGRAGFLVHFPGTTEFQEAITAQLGKTHEILNVTFKRFEASGRALSPMLCALRIAQDEDLNPEEVEAVDVEINAFEAAFHNHGVRRDDHVVHGVAGALTYRSGRGDLIVHHDNPVFLRVADRITIHGVEDLPPICARLTVKTRTQQYYREILDGARSHTFDFEGAVELARSRQEKMRISPATLDKLAAVIRDLETASNVHPIIELVTP